MIRSAAILAVGMAFAVAQPVAAQDRKGELQELVFGTCAKVLEGSVSLENPGQLEALGFAPTAPRETPAGKLPRAEKGSGTEKVVLSSGPGTCSVWFGGPENPALAGGLVERALADKLSGSTTPLRLGDGTVIFVFRDRASRRVVTIILGDAGGELGFRPATTVIVMTEKD